MSAFVMPSDTTSSNASGTSWMLNLMLRLLARDWRWGTLTITYPDGRERRLVGDQAGHSAELHINHPRLAGRVLRGGDIGFADSYIAGEWNSPDLTVLLETLAENFDQIRRLTDGTWPMQAANALRHWLNRNSRTGSRRNIHAHYDLGNDFYSRWLDPSMTYSSARFTQGSETLEAAQHAKYAALSQAMDLRPGQSILEIGCGWGGFAEYAVREWDARITAITLSREQHEFASRRLFEAGLAERVDIRLMDYRDVDGRYDRVASIEMFEAVGQRYWPLYFDKLRQVLKPGGSVGLQIITIADDLFEDYASHPDFIQKYVFPGGMLPSERKLAPHIARAGFTTTGQMHFGIDYARTLRLWAERFHNAWAEIAALPGFDERFRRVWSYYLAYCEAGFRSGRTDVVQLGLRLQA